jgi:uncharacterized tellurite resistance protein B-like protein
MDNETRKLMKLLHLTPDEIYHVFCLALCMGYADGKITDQEGEILTRIGFGLGLSPEDISAIGENAKGAIADTSPADVIAFSIASLKARLHPEQLNGVKQILKFVAASDSDMDSSETAILGLLDELWPESPARQG